jgi:hypothetical protein
VVVSPAPAFVDGEIAMESAIGFCLDDLQADLPQTRMARLTSPGAVSLLDSQPKAQGNLDLMIAITKVKTVGVDTSHRRYSL